MHNLPSWHMSNVTLITEKDAFSGSISVKNGKIVAIYPDKLPADATAADEPVLDGEGGLLMPGFIDVHVHGGYGHDFMDATSEAYDAITRFHASHGTTSLLATTMTAAPEAIDRVLQCAAAYRAKAMPYAAIEGVHLEGPFLNPVRIGAQNPAFAIAPSIDLLTRWTELTPSLLRIVTLAPELENGFASIKWLQANRITAAVGHSDAPYEVIRTAVQYGLTHAVHTYNAMTGLHHREPGTLGAVLTEDTITAEVIADGEHVHPGAIKLLLRAKPQDKTLLITDAMAAAGLTDGRYQLGGLDVNVENGVARLAQGGNLAGSTLTMIEALRRIIKMTGISLVDASRMASANPARAIGIDHIKGTLAAGKQADLVWTDADLHIKQTWVAGRAVG